MTAILIAYFLMVYVVFGLVTVAIRDVRHPYRPLHWRRTALLLVGWPCWWLARGLYRLRHQIVRQPDGSVWEYDRRGRLIRFYPRGTREY